MNNKYSSSETYISIRDITRALGLPSSVLKKKVKSGSIKAVMLDRKNRPHPANKTEPTLDEREVYINANFPELKGKEIWIAEAARKYEVAQPNLSRWADRGFIKKLGKFKNRILLDEADIAYCVAVSRDRSGTRRWLFNDDGTPYTPKRLQLA